MRSLGKDGEDWAVKYLKSNGFKILDKNFRCQIGEIDIVAKDKNTIVFVEVKTRKTDEFAEPFESVGKRKQAKIRDLAEYYLQEKDYSDCEIRFDVLSIVSDGSDKKIEHITNAF
jgi:putative endonuclease